MTYQLERIDELIDAWPETARESAKTVMKRYGTPHEATRHMLAWRDTGPWKWTVITDIETAHEWPTPHVDVLEQAINYQVPPQRFTDLAKFDGSVMAERTRGELSARCAGEAANFLAINLAHEIVIGRRSVGEARERYAQAMQAMTEGREDPYTEALLFDPPAGGTEDPDQQVLPIPSGGSRRGRRRYEPSKPSLSTFMTAGTWLPAPSRSAD